MKKLAILATCLCLASCASWTPEDHARVSAAMQQVGNNMSNQEAANTARLDSANANALNYLEQRSVAQQYSQQADLNNFRQQSFQNNLLRSVNNLQPNRFQ